MEFWEAKAIFYCYAPTGSGKTGITEIAILKELSDRGKAICTVPSHALVDDKIRDFQYLEPKYKVDEGGKKFGDWKNNDLIITTFEMLYRACLFSKEFTKDFGIVVVDEFHTLYDRTRGYNLERLLTILRERDIGIFCISATFEDKHEIGEWLGAKVGFIPNKLRPVPITLQPMP